VSPSTMKEWAKGTIVFLVTLFLCFILIEAVFYFVPDKYVYGWPRYSYIEDDDVNYRLAPDLEGRMWSTDFDITFRTNSLGFRAEELDEREKIVFLGDSFQFGWGVEQDESMSAVFGRFMPEYQIVNLGTPGHGTFHQTKLLEKHYEELHPKAVFYGFVSNDPSDNVRGYAGNEYVYKGFNILGEKTAMEKAKMFLYANFKGLTFFSKRFFDLKTGLQAQRVHKEPILVSFDDEEVSLTIQFLSDLKQLVRQQNGTLIIYAIPSHGGRVNLTFLEAFVDKEDIPYLDFGPIFEDREHPTFAHDAHWNKESHEFAGERLWQHFNQYI